MPSVNNGRSNGGRVLNIPKGRTKPTPKSSMPMARGRDLPLNKESLSSRKAKITKKVGKRITLKSKDQKTEWLFVPKRGPRITKNQRKA